MIVEVGGEARPAVFPCRQQPAANLQVFTNENCCICGRIHKLVVPQGPSRDRQAAYCECIPGRELFFVPLRRYARVAAIEKRLSRALQSCDCIIRRHSGFHSGFGHR